MQAVGSSLVPGAGVENIGLSEISLNGKMVKFAAKYAELHQLIEVGYFIFIQIVLSKFGMVGNILVEMKEAGTIILKGRMWYVKS